MFFNLRNFIKRGLNLAIGKKSDHEIILAAIEWYDKGVLIESDLAILEEAIDAQYTQQEVEENV